MIVVIRESATGDPLYADDVLPPPNYIGRQLQIDIRFENQVLSRLYNIDAIDTVKGVIFVTEQKSYLNNELIERSASDE